MACAVLGFVFAADFGVTLEVVIFFTLLPLALALLLAAAVFFVVVVAFGLAFLDFEEVLEVELFLFDERAVFFFAMNTPFPGGSGMRDCMTDVMVHCTVDWVTLYRAMT
ncbi:MAG: hypothetical protein NPIRA02_21410 [Nitrospirales bacterium]|nr:MAG: hypothetical protein NPIRA02_21410 [Nitrospirales bacterium]